MTYTPPAPESLGIENPTKGRLKFAADVQTTFNTYVDETPSFEVGIAINEDAGSWLDSHIEGYTAAELFATFRDITGQSTDDVDHASAVVYAAAHTVWEALALDYQTYMDELHESD